MIEQPCFPQRFEARSQRCDIDGPLRPVDYPPPYPLCDRHTRRPILYERRGESIETRCHPSIRNLWDRRFHLPPLWQRRGLPGQRLAASEPVGFPTALFIVRE